jgi:uncharacterized protein (TIGR03067 family)
MRALMVIGIIGLLVGADAPSDAVKKEMALFEGEWSLESGEREGQAFPEDTVKSMRREVKDGVSTVTIGDRVVIKSKFTVDPSKKPRQIDFEAIEGEAKGTKLHGVYEFDGDTLKLCLTLADQDRATDFTTKADSGRTLTVWKKVKN